MGLDNLAELQELMNEHPLESHPVKMPTLCLVSGDGDTTVLPNTPRGKDADDERLLRLWVGTLPTSIDVAELRRIFSQFGPVISVFIMEPRYPHVHSAAFVNMAKPCDAAAAIAGLHETKLSESDSNAIIVRAATKLAKPAVPVAKPAVPVAKPAVAVAKPVDTKLGSTSANNMNKVWKDVRRLTEVKHGMCEERMVKEAIKASIRASKQVR